MAKFEGVQRDVLDYNGNVELISAGAGSGKTTVMVEKIANLIIEEKVDVDSLLVVTFTVLAANEMKERLIQKLQDKLNSASLEDKENILNVIEKNKTASIDTIDGFSSKTIKKYFYELEISPNIEIISDATKDYYVTKAMQKTLSDLSENFDQVNLMLDLFGGNRRNFDNLQNMILSTYASIVNIENVDEFLNNCKNEYLDSVKSENIVNLKICELAMHAIKTIQYNFSCFEKNTQTKLLNVSSELEKFNSKLSFKFNIDVLNNLQFDKLGKSDFAKDERKLISTNEIINDINKLIKLKDELKENEINNNYEEKNEKIINYLMIFLEILKNFIKNYNNLKQKNNLIDFNDLNRLMLKLLKINKVKNELHEKYRYIFIDEYQDVNPLQDKLMNELTSSETHVFMVGDVKQSIYGFRGSSPEWFLNKYETLKNNNSLGQVFDMNLNFRSSSVILNFINEIFSSLMTKHTSDIDYVNDAMIEPKRDDITNGEVKILLADEKTEKFTAVGLYSVKADFEKGNLSKPNLENLLVKKILDENLGKPIYDANLKQTRNLTYKDFAILVRSEKDDEKELIEFLKTNNIPINTTNKMQVSSSEGVKLILSILKCVNNTADDVDYLASMLALTNLNIDDIVEISDTSKKFYENLQNNITNDEIVNGFKKIGQIRSSSYVLDNASLIRYILNEQKIKFYLLNKENGKNELKIIDEFISKLSTNENSLNLTEFINFVETNVNNGNDYLESDNEDSVTIQTIHKSKGLEYPVVILYNASKQFSYLLEHDTVNFNLNVGLGFDYYDTENRTKSYSLTKYAIKLLNAEKSYKEELRLLYVALTRAKNKLFILGEYSNKLLSDEEINKTSYMNMILSCFKGRINDDITQLKNCSIEIVDEVCEGGSKKQTEVKEIKLLGEDFNYPNAEKFKIPFKNTVTGINSKQSQEIGYKIKNVINSSVQYDVENRALIGTHYHLALQELDYTTKFVKNTKFDDVDYSKIERAHNTISKLCENSVNIKKEAEFMMYLPYNEILGGEVKDKVLVQGVVDLIIEYENSITIVDYKFSTLPIKILKEKYSEQLELYKLAVEKAFKKPVEHMYIYSIETGELL